ncbi:NAD(P)-dependent oxidoreductase [Jiella sonneratiae]|uniref:NAD(P)-dependent oxidoreductase n=1 Tax=Jiella sonneratiae TaxID=2816856 RepID=A0ABS3J8B4_9HYPH|nr:NAD(P)-dependent oxidoreductase [Jiella sonneratiae]MBO0905915.1 NAD(P)-dependent oxidoreductase [Jiella sonneratiae]
MGGQTVIAVPAAGAMGAGLSARLVHRGARVVTLTEGRSDGTLRRAAAAGMESVTPESLARAPVILSVVPPEVALSTAETFARHVPAGSSPLYVDLNAVNPGTVREIEAVVTRAGARFCDGGIIGLPPKQAAGEEGPRLYVSGPGAQAALDLRAFGLDVALLPGGTGAASGLKMCYGALTKGLTGITTAIILAAEREGLGDALHAELGRSQAALLTRSGTQIPAMFPKAYRWVREMQEISAFLGAGRPEAAIWENLADLYARLATDAGDREAAEAFLGRGSDAER